MRHGQTLFNEREKIQGWTDSPLTELGKRQPLYAKKYFEENGIVFDHVYCSTSERASDTLELITDMPYERLKGIKEMNFGIFDGESEALHQPKNKPNQRAWEDEYVKFGGEDMRNVLVRVNNTLTELMERDDHFNVLAISHAGACAVFTLNWFPELCRETFKLTNCCILKFEYEDGKFTLIEALEHDFNQPL
jgi:probable phosphoglycerate mutase